jgi:deoxycitidine kinase/deoxyguanosine kinase
MDMINVTDTFHVTPFENISGEEEDELEEEEEDNLADDEYSEEEEELDEDELDELDELEEEDDLNVSSSSEYSSILSEEEEEEDEEEPTKIKFVSIEGNIGSGKTTLIHNLKEKYKDREDILFLEEPIDIWNLIQDKNGKTVLEYFYGDLGKYAFPFQVMAYTTRLQLMQETIANASPKVKVVVMERSLEADANIFAKMLYEEGIMNTIEYQIYSLMTENNWEDYGVDGIIWLQTEPEECYSRVKLRNREGEEGIDLGYLRKCHQYHLEWLGANLGFVCNIGEEDDSLELDLEKIDNYLF